MSSSLLLLLLLSLWLSFSLFRAARSQRWRSSAKSGLARVTTRGLVVCCSVLRWSVDSAAGFCCFTFFSPHTSDFLTSLIKCVDENTVRTTLLQNFIGSDRAGSLCAKVLQAKSHFCSHKFCQMPAPGYAPGTSIYCSHHPKKTAWNQIARCMTTQKAHD